MQCSFDGTQQLSNWPRVTGLMGGEHQDPRWGVGTPCTLSCPPQSGACSHIPTASLAVGRFQGDTCVPGDRLFASGFWSLNQTQGGGPTVMLGEGMLAQTV